MTATRTDLPTFDELQWFANTVRPVRTARVVASERAEPVAGLTMQVVLYRGHTGYDHVETWWVLNHVTRHDAPNRLFVRGTRYTGKSCEAKARSDYADGVEAVLAGEGGGA